jgi:hypothetical protein
MSQAGASLLDGDDAGQHLHHGEVVLGVDIRRLQSSIKCISGAYRYCKLHSLLSETTSNTRLLIGVESI